MVSIERVSGRNHDCRCDGRGIQILVIGLETEAAPSQIRKSGAFLLRRALIGASREIPTTLSESRLALVKDG